MLRYLIPLKKRRASALSDAPGVKSAMICRRTAGTSFPGESPGRTMSMGMPRGSDSAKPLSSGRKPS